MQDAVDFRGRLSFFLSFCLFSPRLKQRCVYVHLLCKICFLNGCMQVLVLASTQLDLNLSFLFLFVLFYLWPEMARMRRARPSDVTKRKGWPKRKCEFGDNSGGISWESNSGRESDRRNPEWMVKVSKVIAGFKGKS